MQGRLFLQELALECCIQIHPTLCCGDQALGRIIDLVANSLREYTLETFASDLLTITLISYLDHDFEVPSPGTVSPSFNTLPRCLE